MLSNRLNVGQQNPILNKSIFPLFSKWSDISKNPDKSKVFSTDGVRYRGTVDSFDAGDDTSWDEDAVAVVHILEQEDSEVEVVQQWRTRIPDWMLRCYCLYILLPHIISLIQSWLYNIGFKTVQGKRTLKNREKKYQYHTKLRMNQALAQVTWASDGFINSIIVLVGFFCGWNSSRFFLAWFW